MTREGQSLTAFAIDIADRRRRRALRNSRPRQRRGVRLAADGDRLAAQRRACGFSTDA